MVAKNNLDVQILNNQLSLHNLVSIFKTISTNNFKLFLDKTLSLDSACSHIRAWRLFVESLLTKANGVENSCQFTAFKCLGGVKSFEQGFCFPQIQQSTNSSLLEHNYHVGKFGEDVKGQGIMFFLTKATAPFCGNSSFIY